MEQETDTLIFPSCTYIIHLAGCEKEAELYRKELHIIDQECILYLWENQDAFSEHQPSTIPAFPNSFHFIIKCHGACKVFDMEGCYDARAENLAKEGFSILFSSEFKCYLYFYLYNLCLSILPKHRNLTPFTPTKESYNNFQEIASRCSK